MFWDSVVALLDKYSPTDLHCKSSMLSSCVVKRWFWLYFSYLCQAVWPSIRSIHSFIVCCICTAFITVFIIIFLYCIFSVSCTLCILCTLIITLCILINGWMDGYTHSACVKAIFPGTCGSAFISSMEDAETVDGFYSWHLTVLKTLRKPRGLVTFLFYRRGMCVHTIKPTALM